LVGTGPRSGEGMATFTPEAQEIFGGTDDEPDHLWLRVHFTRSEKSQAAGREFLKRFRLRSENRDPEVNGKVAPARIEAIGKWGAPQEKPFEYLKSIRQPTLVVNGGKDVIIYSVNSFILQQHLPSAQLILYPDANHGSHYGRGAKEAGGVVAEIHRTGSRADAIATDLATADGADKLARQTRSIVGDRLDILVANAGVSKAATIQETTVEDFDNVRAPFFLVQRLLPIMSNGSSIVFASSLAAHAVVGTSPAYAATKGAIDTLVKHFASLLGARGIRVNAVAPGVVETDMSTFTKMEEGRHFACRRCSASRSPTTSVALSPISGGGWYRPYACFLAVFAAPQSEPGLTRSG
jgi:NAD(P)-dependent dehydrogenase (short-subunit alcohol dehydrogenase family)